MASFQFRIGAIALIVLVLILVFVGVSLTYASKKEKWPPMIGVCPDYWLDNSPEGNGSDCVWNLQKDNTGKSTNHMNFAVAPYIGDGSACKKYSWATTKKVSWDGITYGVQNPCLPPPANSDNILS